MATALTAPVIRPSVTYQGITKVEFKIPHKRDLSGLQANIDKDRVAVHYEVSSWNETGEVITRQFRTVPFPDWPASFATDVKAMYAKLETDAKAEGLIGAGTDEPLEP